MILQFFYSVRKSQRWFKLIINSINTSYYLLYIELSVIMNIKDEYERLYQHWLKEFRNTDIVPLSNELFNDYKKNLDIISKTKKDQLNEKRKNNVS